MANRINREIKNRFLLWLVGDKKEMKLGEFWLVYEANTGMEHIIVETDAMRKARLERDADYERRNKTPLFREKKKAHREVIKSECRRLIETPPQPATEEELSFIDEN